MEGDVVFNDKHNECDLNPIEKQIKEIDEYQKNIYNPGHYITSSKIPLPLRNLYKNPIVLILIGIIILVPVLVNITSEQSISDIAYKIIYLIIGLILLISGSVKLVRKMNGKK
ncbi:MAG: hypothetical protein VB130_08025 [Clostridium sp.]|nr:hypothetical protein [Clostridium sp.]